MVLALDPATQLGWATEEESGTISFRTKKTKDAFQRVKLFHDWLEDMVIQNEVTHIIYEKPTMKHFSATRSHSHFEAIIMLVCFDNDITFDYVSASTIKKFATGKGNADKQQMMIAYKAKYKKEPLDDNECDARFLLDYHFYKFKHGSIIH
jgi:Holliday junction resolvasome RuvABC endonuclease subunit